MPVCEGTSQEDLCSGFCEPEQDGSMAGEFIDSRAAGWKMMASAAAGTMLGMPYVSTGTLRAAWAEFSQWLAALQD